MNDIFGAFANAYKSGALDNATTKQDPQKQFNLFNEQADTESQRPRTDSTASTSSQFSQAFGNIKGKIFSQSGQDSQQQQADQPPKPIQFVISKMDDSKDYTKAIICLGLSALFMFISVLSLPTIIISPQKFTTMFTLSMLCLLFALAFLNGPATYVKKLTEKKNLFASAVMASSIILSLYFSIIQGSYLLSLLFCFIEFNAVLLFFCNTFPAGKSGMKFVGGAAKSMLSAPFSK